MNKIADDLVYKIAENEYGKYCVPTDELWSDVTVMAILNGDVWEKETVEHLILIDADKDIIHAGTFFGDFLPALSKSRGDGARIWAFEPCKTSFKYAKETCFINNLENVELRSLGLGDIAGEKNLVFKKRDKKWGGCCRIEGCGGEDMSGWERETVKITTIDDFVPKDRQIGAIHLDIEYYEEKALIGAMETIKRCLPTIILENPPEEWIKTNLFPLGYKFLLRANENSIYVK